MKFYYLVIAMIIGFAPDKNCYAQHQVKDYLSISGPIKFDGQDYDLAWSSHPSDNYYKHEYIQKDDNVEKFKRMVLIEYVAGDVDVKTMVGLKISELNRLKKSNPIVNFSVFKKNETGEYLLDFLVSENTPDGSHINIVERNVYRYIKITDSSGRKGVLLFAISDRAYGNDIDSFFAQLKSNKESLIKEVGKFNVPEVKIVN
jgi:hypothetical protein